MTNRKQLLEELFQTFHGIRKNMLFRDKKAKSHITPPQWMAMRIIVQNSPCTVKNIAEELQMSSSAATQLVDKLVKNGYVTRKENPKDRREAIIALADKTIAEVQELKNEAIKHMANAFKVLSDSELKQLVALNKKVADNMRRKNNNYGITEK